MSEATAALVRGWLGLIGYHECVLVQWGLVEVVGVGFPIERCR